MVKKWGFSAAMGLLAYDDEAGEVFLGRAVTQRKSISDHTAEQIDIEVRNIIDRNYDKARTLLRENRNLLDAMAEALVVRETLSSDEVDAIIDGQPLATPKSTLDAALSQGDSDMQDKPGCQPRFGSPITQHCEADSTSTD